MKFYNDKPGIDCEFLTKITVIKNIIKEPDARLTGLWQITVVRESDREKMIFREVLDCGNVESVAWLPQT